MTFNRQSTIGDIVKAHPDVAPVIMDHGLHCVGCHVAFWETLEQGCRGHGFTEEEIDSLVTDINNFVKEKESSKDS
jgi:hybrid cluster-associated redox disulfide protein